MQRIFKHERNDEARRVQLLLAVDTLSASERPADELLNTSSGPNGSPPPLRLSTHDDAAQSGTPKARASLPPLPKRDGAAATRANVPQRFNPGPVPHSEPGGEHTGTRKDSNDARLAAATDPQLAGTDQPQQTPRESSDPLLAGAAPSQRERRESAAPVFAEPCAAAT